MKPKLAMRFAVPAAVVSLAFAASDAAALPAAPLHPAGATVVEKAQVGIYLGYGRPYRPYYGGYYGPYYRPYGGYYYAPPPPPPVTYYDTRPYVARPAPGYDPDAVARCASRFRSFNVRTGTYVTYEGEERLCPYLR